MEEAARAIARALSIDLEVLGITVDRWSEGSARRERYRVLLGAVQPGEWLLTAHTADDLAETVLANLLRGAGFEGLAGIPARRGAIARPLLGVSRSQTRELATLAGLPWRDDPQNLDLGPLRNRLRRLLIPQLEAEYSPELRSHLRDLAGTISALDREELVSAVEGDGELRLPYPMLMALPPSKAIRSIREAIRPLRSGYSLTRAETDRVWEVVAGRATATELSGKIRVHRSGPWLVLGGPAAGSPPLTEWKVPGQVHWGRYRLEAAVSPRPPEAMPLSPWQAVLDYDRTGDRLLIEAGGEGRPRLRAGGKLVWEPGRRTYPAGWIDRATRRYLSALCVEEGWQR
jgi:tRNA(Ile)-lysidine synthase